MATLEHEHTDALARVAARIADGAVIAGSDLGMLRGPFVTEVLGLEIDEVAKGRLSAHMVVDERHHQPFGIVHGGVWCAVVETVASVAASLHAPAGQLVVGVHNGTDFIRPLRVGGVDVEATSVHVGRSQQLWQVVISRQTDRALVARGQVRLQHLTP